MVRCLKAFIRSRSCFCYFLLLICLLLLVVNYFKIVSNFDCTQRWQELKGALSSASVHEQLKAPLSQPNCCPSDKPALSRRLVAQEMNENTSSLRSQSDAAGLASYLRIPHVSLAFPHFNSSFGKKGRSTDRVHLKYIHSRFKSNNSIVIGIPTVKRSNETIYLYDMLNSLFRAIEDKDRSSILVVLFIAELQDLEFIDSTIQRTKKLYAKELDEGMLDIVVPDPSYYPNMATQIEDDIIFRDPKDRVRWRTKQNYDISYLMSYAQPRGEYYLQLEDDIVSRAGFLSNIRSFIKEKKNENWFMLEFSELGFIGKLFKSTDLIVCINFFLLFSSKQPIDLLIIKILETRACDLNKKADECHKLISKMRLRHNVSLFQHIGLKSSLQGKTQPLKDRFFKEFGGPSDNHQNPPAKVTSTFKHYLDYTVDGVYANRMFFWGLSPDANQFILIHFNKPEPIKRCFIRTSNSIHPLDMLTNDTVVEIKLESGVFPANTDYKLQQDGFLRVGQFDSAGLFNHTFNQPALGPVSQVRVKVVQSIPSHWVLIEELKLYVT